MHPTCKSSKYQCGVASLWPQTTVASAETLYIYIWRWSGMSIRWVGCLKTFNMINDYKSKTERILDTAACCCWFFLPPRVDIVWGCILMTTSQSRMRWNTVYMYEVDLLYEYEVGGFPQSYGNLQHIASEKPRDSPTATATTLYFVWNHLYISVGVVESLWPVATVAGGELHYIYVWRRPDNEGNGGPQTYHQN
jgi:hypothetical protein